MKKTRIGFEQTWRWFGPQDPISLKEIKQTGATGIVTALHHLPIGEIWTVDEITKRKQIIESEGLVWSVVESVPVHENIKKQKDNYRELFENFKKTIQNLGKCGINLVCYNFMPVLDWSRTDLRVVAKDGSITTKFDAKVFTAFDLFILKRDGARKNYNEVQINSARAYYAGLDYDQKIKLTETILLGLPGSLETFTLDEFRTSIEDYKDIGVEEFRHNLLEFIREVIPVAEESGVFLAIHPDDPPFPLLGLPRVVSSKLDIEQILNAVDSSYNGLTLCTGSFGAGYKNNLEEITECFADKINFVHLRNVIRNEQGDFLEDNHLDGDIDIYSVMRILLLEQKRRIENGNDNRRMPMRPDHGHLMIPDMNRKGIYPGYSLFGRMRGLAELRGMEIGIIRSLVL
jgi:mannonate dehydratase